MYAGLPIDALAIPLVGGEFALVSAEDFDELSVDQWSVVALRPGDPRRLYAYRTGTGNQMLAMHKAVSLRAFGPRPHGLVVDHINGDSLDNRRENLRYVTQSENKLNWHREITPDNVARYRFSNRAAATGFLTRGVLARKAYAGKPLAFDNPLRELGFPVRRRTDPMEPEVRAALNDGVRALHGNRATLARLRSACERPWTTRPKDYEVPPAGPWTADYVTRMKLRAEELAARARDAEYDGLHRLAKQIRNRAARYYEAAALAA